MPNDIKMDEDYDDGEDEDEDMEEVSWIPFRQANYLIVFRSHFVYF